MRYELFSKITNEHVDAKQRIILENIIEQYFFPVCV